MKKHKLDHLGVSAFCESMAMMIQSGIQTDEAISLLENSHQGGPLEQGLKTIREKIEQGLGLAKAMEESGSFPDYALRMIAAGESSGHLEDIMFRLSQYYAEQKTISEKLRNAVTYPAAMLVLIIAVLAAMISMVLPAFADVYNRLTGSLTGSSYGYIRWAYGICWAALGLMALLALALILGLLLWNSEKRETVEAALRRVPLCASILDNLAKFRFVSALSTFIASGEMQDDAVLNSIPMADSKHVEEKLKQCRKRMEEGHSIAQAAYDEQLFEPVYNRMLLAGERSGNMESVLRRISELLEENCGQLVERLVGIVDPLLSGVLMLTVGLSLLSIMLPLIGMMNAIG